MINKPVFSEKSFAATALGTFTFKVDKHTTKTQIKQLIHDLYQVDVVAVRTSNTRQRTAKSMKNNKSYRVRGSKKAMVTLKPGQKIELFNT